MLVSPTHERRLHVLGAIIDTVPVLSVDEVSERDRRSVRPIELSGENGRVRAGIVLIEEGDELLLPEIWSVVDSDRPATLRRGLSVTDAPGPVGDALGHELCWRTCRDASDRAALSLLQQWSC